MRILGSPAAKCIPLLLALLVVLPSSLFGYYHFLHYPTASPPFTRVIEKFDLGSLIDGTVYFYVSRDGPQLAANDSYEALVSQVRQALSVWDSVPSSELGVAYGGISEGLSDAAAPSGAILFAELPPGVIGLGGPVTRAEQRDGFMPIVRSQVILSNDLTSGGRPKLSFSEQFFNSLVHEIGHALGLQHSLTGSVMSTDVTRATTRALPLAADDVAGLAVAYPTASFLRFFGGISGRVVSTTGRPIHLASVVAIGGGGNIVVSSLTDPDGRYQIQGLLPGPYRVYAHPLPPATQAGLGPANVVLPTTDSGETVASGGVFKTVFYGGSNRPLDSPSVWVAGGTPTADVDFTVTPLADLALHSVTTFSFPGNGAPGVHPAFVDNRDPTAFVLATGPGLIPHLAEISLEIIGSDLRPARPILYAFDARFARVDFEISPFSGLGPKPLLFRLRDDIYVLPSAVRLTSQRAPVVHWIEPDFSFPDDEVWSVRGQNFGPRALVYFDGLPGTVVGFDEFKGEILVRPPPGPPGRQAVVTVYSPDGQSSAFTLPDGNVVLAYPDGIAPSLVLSRDSAEAGSDVVVEIDGLGTDFTPHQTVVGFGTSDIVTRDLEVVSPERLRVVITIRPQTEPGPYLVTVTSGLQLAEAAQRFRVDPADPDDPRPKLSFGGLVNSATRTPDLSPGVLATLFGSRLSAEPSAEPVPAVLPTVTLDGQEATVLAVTPDQIDLRIPITVEPGVAELRVRRGPLVSEPMLVRIASVSPGLFRAVRSDGSTVGTGNPAQPGEGLLVLATGLGVGDFFDSTEDLGTVQLEINRERVEPLSLREVAGFPGLYELGMTVPDEIADGPLSISLLVEGRRGNTLALPVAPPLDDPSLISELALQ